MAVDDQAQRRGARTSTHGGLTEVDYGAMIRALNDVHYGGETAFYRAAPLRPCEEALHAAAPVGVTILDVGCGAGRITGQLTARGARIVGLDLCAAAVTAGHQRFPDAAFVRGSMTGLPVRSGAFDQVWCLRFSFNALPTRADRVATLRELWRVCALGGAVYVEAFNWYHPGRFGLLRLANILDQWARRLRWHGQGRVGSQPLPERDIIYLANKAAAAAPGYAHLTTPAELGELAAAAGLTAHATVTTEAEVRSGRLVAAPARHRGYSTWLVLRQERP